MARLPRLPKSMFRPPPGFKKPKVEDFRSDMQRVGEEIAEQFKEQVIENIETNYYGFELAQSTIERKGSDVPWINSHELVDSIYREGTVVSVEDTPREDSKLTNLQLAIVQEYGTKDRHIPPRPIFRNTFRDFESDAKDKMLSFFKTGKFDSVHSEYQKHNSTVSESNYSFQPCGNLGSTIKVIHQLNQKVRTYDNGKYVLQIEHFKYSFKK
jgi:hypothetical protein